ncbi:MAG: ParB/RepB/Spo0J family partition protein [Chloroflexota bacterium]|nr:ParB/RepB/Spo0J family partition protein [Chloroflexota bacterium]
MPKLRVVETLPDFETPAPGANGHAPADAIPSLPAMSIVLEEIPLDWILPGPHNPRVSFDTAAMQELTASIEHYGIQEPLKVRPIGERNGHPLFEIVFGHRRHHGARAAGLATAPCMVEELTEDEALELTQIENLQREDVSAVEEARGFKDLRKRRGWTQQQLGDRLGKSQSYVANRERLLELPEPLQKAIISREIAPASAVVLAAVKPPPAGVKVECYTRHEGKDYTVRGPEDLWKLAAAGMSQHDLETVVREYERQCKYQAETKSRDAAEERAFKNKVDELKKQHPDVPVFRVRGYNYYAPKPAGAVRQVNSSGEEALSKSDACADCKACKRTGFVVWEKYSAVTVSPVCVDQRCNDSTKHKYRRLARERADEVERRQKAVIQRIRTLPAEQLEPKAFDLIRRKFGYLYGEAAEVLKAEPTLLGLARCAALTTFVNSGSKDQQSLLVELGIEEPPAAKGAKGKGKDAKGKGDAAGILRSLGNLVAEGSSEACTFNPSNGYGYCGVTTAQTTTLGPCIHVKEACPEEVRALGYPDAMGYKEEPAPATSGAADEFTVDDFALVQLRACDPSSKHITGMHPMPRWGLAELQAAFTRAAAALGGGTIEVFQNVQDGDSTLVVKWEREPAAAPAPIAGGDCDQVVDDEPH